MAEDVKTTAAEVAAAVTGPTTPDNVSVTRPTAKSEWTLFLALGSLCMFAMILIGILAWKHWPDSTDTQRIFFLGWMGFLAVGGIRRRSRSTVPTANRPRAPISARYAAFSTEKAPA
jgi:hypothetical protein